MSIVIQELLCDYSLLFTLHFNYLPFLSCPCLPKTFLHFPEITFNSPDSLDVNLLLSIK